MVIGVSGGDGQASFTMTFDPGNVTRGLDQINNKLREQTTLINRANAADDRSTRSTVGNQRTLQNAYRRTTTIQANAARTQRRNLDQVSTSLRSGLLNELNNLMPAAIQRGTANFSTLGSGATTALSGATLQAGLLTGAIGVGVVGAIAAASAGLNEFGRQYREFIDAEMERVGIVQQTVQALDLGRAQARAYVQETQRAIAVQGRDTPVSVSQIQAFYAFTNDDFADFYRNQGLGLDQIRTNTIQRNTQLALLQQMNGVDMNTAGANIRSYLGGATYGEVKNFTLFQSLGKRERDLLREGLESGADRIKLLSEILDSAISDEVIAELQVTAGAKLSSFMDSLFNSEIGLFSIARDLEPDVPGYQSVATEFSQTIDLILGPDGLVKTLAESLDLVDFDPMIALRNSITDLNEFLKELNEIIEFFGRVRDPSLGAPNAAFKKLTDAVGYGVMSGFGFYNPVGDIYNKVEALTATPRFRGSLADIAPMPLDAAIALEMQNKPIGSRPELVVMNTSEVILNKEQVRQIAGAGGAGPVFNITIHQAAGQSSEQLVNQLLAEINRRYEFEKGAKL